MSRWLPWGPWRWVQLRRGQLPGSVLASLCRQLRASLGQSGVELGQVVIKVGLAKLHIRSCDVLDKHAEVNTVQALDRIVDDCVAYVVNGSSKLVASDGADKVVGSPHFTHRGVLCPEFLTLMGGGAGRYNGTRRRFGCWYVN